MNRRRGGVTLIELVISLAVLTLIAAVALPQLSILLVDRRLARAADLVQIELGAARLEAIRSGRILVMSGRGQHRLHLGTFHRSTDAVESDDQTGASALATGADAAGAIALDARGGIDREIELPDQTALASIQTLRSSRDFATTNDTTAAGLNAVTQATDAPGDSVYFYPDGTTSDAIVTVADPDGEFRQVLLRGIVGRAFQPVAESSPP